MDSSHEVSFQCSARVLSTRFMARHGIFIIFGWNCPGFVVPSPLLRTWATRIRRGALWRHFKITGSETCRRHRQDAVMDWVAVQAWQIEAASIPKRSEKSRFAFRKLAARGTFSVPGAVSPCVE